MIGKALGVTHTLLNKLWVQSATQDKAVTFPTSILDLFGDLERL